MENAAKALMMAGGILLAILILSLIIYVSTTSTRITEAQESKIATQQTSEFNKQYEAYNKSRMYGTDIISIVNKAIDYNRRLDIDGEEKDYKINIILEITEDFKRTVKTVTQKANGEIEYKDLPPISEGTLIKGTYQLFEGKSSTKMNDSILNFVVQSEDRTIEEKKATYIKTTYEYSAMKNFKRAFFQCTNVGYSEVTGRVNSMTFSQI